MNLTITQRAFFSLCLLTCLLLLACGYLLGTITADSSRGYTLDELAPVQSPCAPTAPRPSLAPEQRIF